MTTRIDGNMYVSGRLTPLALDIPAQALTDAGVHPSADIAAEKQEHQFQPTYSQPNSAATTETRVLHVVQGATAELLEVLCGSVAAAVGAATVTLDIKKNGTTVLSGVITLDSGNAAYTPESGTVTVPAAVAGDVYTAVITATAGGGTLPTGFYCSLKLREKAD